MKKKRKTIVVFLTIMLILSMSVGMATADISAAQGSPNSERIKVLIGFTNMPGQAEEALVKSFGGKIKYTYTLIPTIAAELPIAAIDALRGNPKISIIENDIKVYEIADEYDNAWGINRIGERTAHGNGYFGADVGGNGIKVAVIDSGIDYNHPELAGVYAGGKDFVNNDNNPMDIDGHGTHVAGIIAAELNNTGVVGAAPGVKLYALKALEGGSGYFSDIIAALQWCGENDIRVTNNSYGSSTDPGTQVKDAFDAAYYVSGVLHVASAGNSGNPSGKGDNVGFPARYASVMAVAASDSSDRRASFSSTGPDVEIMAPGVSINSTYLNGGYKALSGTSMASPHVAGVAAQVWAMNAIMTNSDVRTILKNTAENLGLPATHQGAGLVRADLATNSLAVTETGTVAGTIRDHSSGLVIPGALVIIEGTSYSASSGADGKYQITGVPVGKYSLTAAASGYESKTTTDVNIYENTNSICDFTLIPITMYKLTIDQVGDGTTNPINGVHSYASGAVVELHANPASGYVFDKWVIEGVDIYFQDTNITMDSDKVAVAHFSGSAVSPNVSVRTDKSEYSGNTWVYITATVEDTVTANPVSGMVVSVKVVPPSGSSSLYSGTTDSTGNVVFKHRILKTSAKGVYSVVASIVWDGSTISNITTFVVK